MGLPEQCCVGNRWLVKWHGKARFQMHIAHKLQNGGLAPHYFELRNSPILRPLIAPYLKNTSVFSALLFLKHTIHKMSSPGPSQFCCFGRSKLPAIYVLYFSPRDWSCCTVLRFSGKWVWFIIEYQEMNVQKNHLDYTEQMMHSGIIHVFVFLQSAYFPFLWWWTSD